MRIAILCNDRIALPALDHLVAAGMVVAVGMSDRPHEIQYLIRNKCKMANMPFELFNKKKSSVYR